MPNKKSAERVAQKHQAQCSQQKTKRNREKIGENQLKSDCCQGCWCLKNLYQKTFQAIDKAAKNGVIKKGTAARKNPA